MQPAGCPAVGAVLRLLAGNAQGRDPWERESQKPGSLNAPANDLEAAPSPERPPARCLDLPLYPQGPRRHHPTPPALIRGPRLSAQWVPSPGMRFRYQCHSVHPGRGSAGVRSWPPQPHHRRTRRGDGWRLRFFWTQRLRARLRDPGLGASSPAQRSRAAKCRLMGFCSCSSIPVPMLPGNPFKVQMSQLVKSIQATPRRPGVEEIRNPLQRAVRERERRRVYGILVDRAVIAALEAL
jgi:hypothetical protein